MIDDHLLGRDHPLLQRLLSEPSDGAALSILASSIYSILNRRYEELTDSHEREFHMALLQKLLDTEATKEKSHQV